MKIIVISDVDGCLTDGGMYYSNEGKVMKRFSAGDHDGVRLFKKNNIDVLFISADKVSGGSITSARIKDMSNSELHFISEKERLNFIKDYKKNYDLVIFFGDGLGDAQVKINNACDIFVCPNQALNQVKEVADFICQNEGGHQAYLEMSLIISKYLKDKYNKTIEFLY